MGGCIGAKKEIPEQPKEQENKPLVQPAENKEEVKRLEGGDIYRPENIKESKANLLNPHVEQAPPNGIRGSGKDIEKPKLNLERLEPDRLRHTEAKDLKESKLYKTVAISRIDGGDYFLKEKQGIKLRKRIQQAFVNNGETPGFEHPDLKDKCIQTVNVQVTINNDKQEEKWSYYYDETRGVADALERNNMMPNKAELVMEDLPELRMAQIKTYLFDRSLASRLTE